MFDMICFYASMAVVGGFAANALLIQALLGIAFGEQDSCIRKERRLPIDSDLKLFSIGFAVGASIGIAIAASIGVIAWEFVAVAGVVAFIAGSAVAMGFCVKLNGQYLARAYENFHSGNFREAIEDASEVARSSERLRSEAEFLIADVIQMRDAESYAASDGHGYYEVERAEELTTASIRL